MRKGLAALFLLTNFEAFAAHEVIQAVRTELDGKRVNSVHRWIIDGGRFRLTVKDSDRETIYVFNGRNLYICGALGAEQLAFLKRHQVNNAELLEKLKRGACQAVPSNFMARFFLAPSEAVESIDRSDGLRLTLEFEGYKVKDEKRHRTVQGEGCEDLDRQYTLVKSDDSGAVSLKLSSQESLCQSKTIKWRDTLWREVSMAVIRQPGGHPFLTKLREDMGAFVGLPLEAKSTFSYKAGAKVAQSGKRSLETRSIKSVPPRDKTFAIPDGYEIFNPEGVKIADTAKPEAKGKSAPEDPLQSLLHNATSIFFCAISGALGCFSD